MTASSNPKQFSVDGLRRRARAIKKERGLSHHEGLLAAAQEAGYKDWHAAATSLSRIARIEPAAQTRFPAAKRLPRPRGIKYALALGRGFRPPTRMSLELHRRCARTLNEIRPLTYDRVGIRNRIEGLRCTLDDWVQCEYDAHELSNDEFHELYYDGTSVGPSDPLFDPRKHQETIHAALSAVERCIVDGYPDCKPRDRILNDVVQARKLFERWCSGAPSRTGVLPTQKKVREPLPQARTDLGSLSAAETIRYAIERQTLCLERFNGTYKRNAIRRSDEFRRDFPYVLRPLGTPNRYCLVNRYYKPLGLERENWVDYEDYPNSHVTLSEAELAEVVAEGHTHGMYADGVIPWRSKRAAKAYVGRLERLQSILSRNQTSPD